MLACNGNSIAHTDGFVRLDSGFVCCNSVINPILDLSLIHEEKYDSVISFLDITCGLFDSIQRDRNKVSNIINLLCKTFLVTDDSMILNIQMFLNMHKNCGVYLMLTMKEDFECLMR